jgi:superfamily II DNA or RNA helicase
VINYTSTFTLTEFSNSECYCSNTGPNTATNTISDSDSEKTNTPISDETKNLATHTPMGPAEKNCRTSPRKSTVVFAANVQHISSLVAAFKQIAGVEAVGVHGATPKSERAEILDRFNNGECMLYFFPFLVFDFGSLPFLILEICLFS